MDMTGGLVFDQVQSVGLPPSLASTKFSKTFYPMSI